MTARAERRKCVAIYLAQIVHKCIYLETDDFSDIVFIVAFPNMIEKD